MAWTDNSQKSKFRWLSNIWKGCQFPVILRRAVAQPSSCIPPAQLLFWLPSLSILEPDDHQWFAKEIPPGLVSRKGRGETTVVTGVPGCHAEYIFFSRRQPCPWKLCTRRHPLTSSHPDVFIHLHIPSCLPPGCMEKCKQIYYQLLNTMIPKQRLFVQLWRFGSGRTQKKKKKKKTNLWISLHKTWIKNSFKKVCEINTTKYIHRIIRKKEEGRKGGERKEKAVKY